MTLNKTDLKAGISAILRDMQNRDSDSIEEFSNRLATEIDSYIKMAKITYISGLTAPNGPVTGVFNGKLE